MLQTYLSEKAAQRLRHGVPWVYRDEVVSVDGTPVPGEPAQLLDSEGQLLGVGDVDLDAKIAVRRIGLPEEQPEGLIQRQLRRAMERRAMLVDDPRFCRVVNDDGDSLPGLVIDRYESHYAIQTLTKAMDARTDEIARSLVEMAFAKSVLLRNDSPRRLAVGLPKMRPKVLYGAPPRWSRISEMGARLTIDLHSGHGTGYIYELREVRRLVGRMAAGARVFDPCCYVGGKVVQAGLHGAKQVVAFDADADAVELARENAEMNGLMGRTHIEHADARTALEQVHTTFDLVLLDTSYISRVDDPANGFVELLRRCVRATRHGGRLIASVYHPHVDPAQIDPLISKAFELEGRVGFRLFRAGLPPDFPTVLGGPMAETLSAIALEVS